MPETEKPHSTTAFNRRSVIAGGAAAACVAATAALPAVASAQHAPAELSEMIEARRLAMLCWQAHGGAASCEDDTPEQQAYDAVTDACYAAMDRQIARIAAKPKLSLPDLAAVALIARMRSTYSGDPNSVEADLARAHMSGDEGEYALLLLMAGVVELAEGQTHA